MSRISIQCWPKFVISMYNSVSSSSPTTRKIWWLVLSTIRLADVHQRASQAMPRKERDKFIRNMRYCLLFQGANFQMELGGTELNTSQFTGEIYYDGLIKNKLREVLRSNCGQFLDLVMELMSEFRIRQPSFRFAAPLINLK